MSFPPHDDPRVLRPLHVVLIVLAAAVVGGGFLLLSAAESRTLVDGAVPWTENSPLRAVVQLLCLNYEWPTVYAGDVKGTILGMGTGLALLALALSVLTRRSAEPEERSTHPERVEPPTDPAKERLPLPPRGTHVPLIAAQAAFGLYVLWSFASARWSDAPELAIGGSILLAIGFLWSFALGEGLSPAAARKAAIIVIVATGVASGVAIAYYYGRNWTIRAKFPFGNPNFLSACLIPGILLSLGAVLDKLFHRGHEPFARRAAGMFGALLVLAPAVWAMALADSRGPLIGLAGGLVAMAYLGLRGWSKAVPILVGVALAIGAAGYFHQHRHQAHGEGRDATLRFRFYAWSYAWELFREKPFNGHGQAGYVRKADLRAAGDVEADPLVLSARVDHTHNEWLEVLADLGVVGLSLVTAGLVLTGTAGGLARNGAMAPWRRWTLPALLGALVGLVLSEGFGVGLRTAEVPVAYYTVLGLIWALAGGSGGTLMHRLGESRPPRLIAGSVLGAAGVLVMILSQQDFRAARQAYQVETALAAGDHEQALGHALQATRQLNPQRALTNLYRLAEVRMQIARDLLSRAVDRESRMRALEVPDPAMQTLAAADRAASEQQAAEASRVLKELVTLSPGFLNHGYVEFMLNLITADHAAARGDESQRALAVQNALRAIERELRRQPFDGHIARDYVRVAGKTANLGVLLRTLARPLRHQAIAAEDVAILSLLSERPDFEPFLESLIAQENAVEAEPNARSWRPEELRLLAAHRFTQGRFEDAVAILRQALSDYESFAAAPLLGAAAASAELGDALFFARPHDAAAPLEAAEHALRRAPESRPGRALRDAVRSRRIDYLLASDRVEEARDRLLEEARDANHSEELAANMAERLRRLSEAVLRSRLTPEGSAPAEVLAPVTRWLSRAMTLDDHSPTVRLTLAQVALISNDDPGAAAHLSAALERGLAPETAQRFLQGVRDRGRDMRHYAHLMDRLLESPPAAP